MITSQQIQISKGSTSQGIHLLRGINALSTAYLHDDRRDHRSSGIAQGATPGYTAPSTPSFSAAIKLLHNPITKRNIRGH